MKQRNYEIDFWKFVFSIVIVFLHSFNLFDGKNLYMVGGSIGVDFFFIVSGFLMMKSLKNKTNIQSGGAFLWHKFKIIMPYFYISIIIAFFLRSFFSIDPAPTMHKLLLLLNEILLLQAAGFSVYAVTGSAWYLSAMFIAIGILFPLAVILRGYYENVLSLIIAVIILGSLSSSIGSTSNPGYMVGGIVFLGLLKAISEIALGCFAHGCVQHLKCYTFNNITSLILSLIKYSCFIFVIYFATLNDSNSYLMFSCVPILFIGIVLSFLDNVHKVSLPSFLQKSLSYLGELSIAIYLNNFYVSLIIAKLYNNHPVMQKMLYYLISVFIISNIVVAMKRTVESKLLRG